MAKKYTQAEWARIQSKLPEEDRVPYEQSPDAAPDVSGQGLDEESASLLALVIALRGIDENLRLAYEEYIKPQKNMAEFRRLVKASILFTNYDKTARARKIIEQEQPGVWKQQKDRYVTEQKKRIIGALGSKAWTPDVQKQVELAFEFALDDDVLDKLIVEFGKLGTVSGAQATTIEDLQSFANSYGVSSLYTDKYWETQKQGLFLGTITEQEIKDDIKQKAIEAYPAWAEGFSKGKSLDTQAGWILSLVGKQLGIDPNALTFNDPRVEPFLSYKDPKTGLQVIPSILDVRTETRRNNFNEFAKTPEGTSYIDGLTVKMLQDMGLM